MFEVPAALTYAGACFVTLAGIWALFDRAEQTATNEGRAELARALRTLSFGDNLRFSPNRFIAMFDTVFGRRFLQISFLLRSISASIFAVLVLTLFHYAVSDYNTTDAFGNPKFEGRYYFFWFGSLALLTNIIPDYFSLIATRQLIGVLVRKVSIARVLLIIALDLIATIFIFATAYLLFSTFYIIIATPIDDIVAIISSNNVGDSASYDDFASIFELPPDLIWAALKFSFEFTFLRLDQAWAALSDFRNHPLSIFFYSTFFTSAWLWIFVLTTLLASITRYIEVAWGWFSRTRDLDNNPHRSLGFLANLLLGVLMLVAAPFVIFS